MAKRLFQIAYDEQLLLTRARILRGKGYEVLSAFGNESAKALLAERPEVDLFVIGHNAPEPTRLEMASWLRRHYPAIRILAFNPSGIAQLNALKFNAPFDAPPETWLPLVQAAVRA
jgi:DNA-binding NarL/FixJ family response regulator